MCEKIDALGYLIGIGVGIQTGK